MPQTGSLISELFVLQQHMAFLLVSLLQTHDRAISYTRARRQEQSRHLCSAQAPQTEVSCFAMALRARCSRTEALFCVVSWVLAKLSTVWSPRSICWITSRYAGFNSSMTS